MNIDTTQSKPFDHPQNITVGLARVIYGPLNTGWQSRDVWHLVGCRVTSDKTVAMNEAILMDKLMRTAERVKQWAM